MEIEQKFHDFCEGCPYIDIVHCRAGTENFAGYMVLYESFITCKNYALCEHLFKRLESGQSC